MLQILTNVFFKWMVATIGLLATATSVAALQTELGQQALPARLPIDRDVHVANKNVPASNFLDKSSRGQDNMVATVHPLATNAGLQALERGGNAVDAAIAAALTLGVVDGFNSGIGGGCFVLIRCPDGRCIAIDGREMAPAAAHRDMFLESGKPNTQLSQTGPLAVAVPGALAAYVETVQEFGRRPVAELLEEGAKIAEQGFEISPLYARQIRGETADLEKFPASRAIFLDEQGQPWPAGHRLVQKDLARTYRQIAAHGVDWFYQGEFATRTAAWMAEHGGLITAEDFSNYRTKRREPLRTRYRDWEVVGFPPPSSGGVHVAQILNILENFDLPQLHREHPEQATHLVAEAMKLAFADRAYWLGDPAFADVPQGLTNKQYAHRLAQQISLDRATDVAGHGQPQEFDPRFFEKHTTHIAAADREGYWVAITTTVNTTFGSKVVIPGLGVVLNNQMDDFAIAPGVPNAFGLVGNENNQVEAGKRPLSSMSPTIVLRDGQPVMTVGAAGGPRIITQALLAIVRTIDFGLPLDQAVSQPRFHQQWAPPLLYLEQGFPESQRAWLEQAGHRVESTRTAGVTQAIWFDANRNEFWGVADPRAGGLARGTHRQ
jgi:gamma-glutamyltranspeptidase/glutathione hydrolase